MRPLPYDLRFPAAKDRSITRAAAAPSNLDAAITMRSAETELQNTLEELATGVRNCSSKTGISAPKQKRTILKHFFKGILKGISPALELKNLLTDHNRTLDAATPIRFTISSCKRPQYYARSRGTKQPWRSHYNAISRDWVAKTQKNYAQDRRQTNAWTGSSTAGPIWEWSDPNRACSATARRKSFPVHLPGHVLVLSCKTKHFVHPLTFKIALRARLPSKSENGRCENELKIWKRSFRARRPSKSERGRCENEALVRDVPQNLKVRFLC